MKSRLVAVILSCLGLLIVSCSPTGKANTESTRTARARTEVIQPSTVSDQFEAPGTVRARVSTVLSAESGGQILSLNAREGDRVRRGQVLGEIDNRAVAAQLRRAQAAAAETQRALEEADRTIRAAEATVAARQASQDLAASTQKRYELLRERHSVSPQEYEEIETKHKAAVLETERAREDLAAAKARRLQIAARIDQADAEIDAANVALEHSRIISPINGVVTKRQADPGMQATPGMPLLGIEDDQTYELEVAVEESKIGKIGLGQNARVEIDALPGEWTAKVREIVPSSDPATRTYAVKLQISTSPSNETLRSGFFGRASFSVGDRKALIIPESALARHGQLEGVYIVENEIALLRLVKTGKHYDHGLEVLSGLTPGTRIVTTPNSEIADGVKIIDEQSSRNTP